MTPHAQPSAGRVRLAGALIALTGLASAAFFVPSIRATAAQVPRAGESLPAAPGLPDFDLIDQDGAAFTKKSLAGSVWIFDFIFTKCSGPCPVMNSRMAALARDLVGSSRVRLASISVDPEHDTPKVLTDFARMSGAPKGRWIFLTGTKPAVFALSREGFRLGVEENGPESAGKSLGSMPLLHSTRFALVDGRARIRGYYDGTEEDAVARLIADARRLSAEDAP